MNTLENFEYQKLSDIYTKYFSLGYLGKDISKKFALISLTCYVTKALRKKGKNLNCYEVLLQIFKDITEREKNTFLKALGVICEDFIYQCEEFPTFDLEPKEMPKIIRKIYIENYLPF